MAWGMTKETNFLIEGNSHTHTSFREGFREMVIKEQRTTTDGSRGRREWYQVWGMNLYKGVLI